MGGWVLDGWLRGRMGWRVNAITRLEKGENNRDVDDFFGIFNTFQFFEISSRCWFRFFKYHDFGVHFD